jgi:hypothetical protein
VSEYRQITVEKHKDLFCYGALENTLYTNTIYMNTIYTNTIYANSFKRYKQSVQQWLIDYFLCLYQLRHGCCLGQLYCVDTQNCKDPQSELVNLF